jgi:hypothetical protein
MFRKHLQLTVQLVAAATLAAGASGSAVADDSSMSRLTGDSYAFFNDLDYRAGHFNVARAPQALPQNPIANMPDRDVDQAERRILLAERPRDITLRSPFRDDTGA